MEINLYECTQCGSTDYEGVGPRRVRCAHCGSLYQVLTDEPEVVISNGAQVEFGKTANVEVRGDLEVEDGAEVRIDGKVTVLKGGKQRVFKLKRIIAEKRS